VSDVPVYYARDEISAEVAASALRGAGLHPRVAVDDGPGLFAAGFPAGRRILYVPRGRGP
jgi:hypothetical protein